MPQRPCEYRWETSVDNIIKSVKDANKILYLLASIAVSMIINTYFCACVCVCLCVYYDESNEFCVHINSHQLFVWSLSPWLYFCDFNQVFHRKMNKNHSISTSIDAKEKIMMRILIYTALGRNVALETEAIIFTNISFNCVPCMSYYI